MWWIIFIFCDLNYLIFVDLYFWMNHMSMIDPGRDYGAIHAGEQDQGSGMHWLEGGNIQ